MINCLHLCGQNERRISACACCVVMTAPHPRLCGPGHGHGVTRAEKLSVILAACCLLYVVCCMLYVWSAVDVLVVCCE